MPEGEVVVVIGLGRFGMALAKTMVRLGYEVLAIERSADLVQRYAKVLTHVVEADGTDPEALRQLGVDEIHLGVVAIGTDLEASVLATAAMADLGVDNIWAKALNERHKQILERVGAHHVVLPEAEMGERVAHLLTGRMMEYLELDDGEFVVVETTAPRRLFGQTLSGAGVRAEYGVTILSIRPKGGRWTFATEDTLVSAESLLLVGGEPKNVERFSNLP